jgi:3-hydroxybutyryl-CoA dehydrogenase
MNTENPRSWHSIGIVGSGAMGAGIAQIALVAGFRVYLHDTDALALARAEAQIKARLDRLEEKGQLDPGSAEKLLANLELAANLSDLEPSQVVIEAIIERLEIKQKLFAALESVVSPATLLATNTSSLQVTAVGSTCVHRERIFGMHFFNPVPLMKLVEIIGAAETSEATLEAAVNLAHRLKKTPVRAKDVPGFLVNLAGRAYATEALHIQHEGVAEVGIIDWIMREAAGFRMGPFELMDLTGIDVNFPATQYIYEGFQHDPRLKTTLLHESLFKAGHFGRKTGQGFHAYGIDGNQAALPEAQADVSAADQAPAVCLGEDEPNLRRLAQDHLRLLSQNTPDVPVLIAPVGEDATTMAARLKLDPSRTVAIDFVGFDRKFLTLMGALGAHQHAMRLAVHLRSQGFRVAVLRDSPGFVAPRILFMIANLGCEIAQTGMGTPKDIDLAMRLAQNYPRGPLEWAEHLGARRTWQALRELQEITGSDRYRPSLWLRRRAQLDLSIYHED